MTGLRHVGRPASYWAPDPILTQDAIEALSDAALVDAIWWSAQREEISALRVELHRRGVVDPTNPYDRRREVN